MSGKTSHLSSLLLGALKGTTVGGFPQTWVTLFTTAPTSDDTGGINAGVEWSPDTARIRVKSSGSTLSDQPYWTDVSSTSDGAETQNVGAIEWADISGLTEAATVEAVGVYSAESGGQLLYWQNLTKPRTVDNGSTMLFMSGTLKVVEK